jgi:hypothetical protein
MQIDKHLLHRARVIRIEREAFARPIARAAEPLQLFENDAAVFLAPFPRPAQELFAAEIVAA